MDKIIISKNSFDQVKMLGVGPFFYISSALSNFTAEDNSFTNS